MDFETGELKHEFISFKETSSDRGVGQLECLQKSIITLYPASMYASIDYILQLIQAYHDALVSDNKNEPSIQSGNNQKPYDDSFLPYLRRS